VDQPANPSAIVFDGHGRLFVADAGQGAIWAVPAKGGTARQWMVDSAVVQPDTPFGPAGLAIDTAGRLVYAVPSTGMDDAGAVYAQKIADDGGPGARTTLATLAAGAHPTGVVVSAAGNVYVSLADLGQVAVFGPDGAPLRQIIVDRSLQAGRLLGLTFDGKDLLVAGAPATADAPSAIVRIAVGEPGAPVYGRSTT
jgi:sugar lactone lactonase YvrE